jgi:hypothetical protein
MYRPLTSTALLILLLAYTGVSWAQSDERIKPEEAKNHVGDQATVCGLIVDFRRELPSAFSPPDPSIDGTLLFFDQPHPDHEFMGVIENTYRKEFPYELQTLKGKKACVFGKIQMYKGKAMIALVRPEQIATSSGE